MPSLRRWGVAVAAAMLTGLGMPVVAQTTVPAATETRSINDWLTRMHEASRQRAYQGTLVVSAGSAMSASRIWHVCDGVQQMERVETLTGAPRTTLRRNNDVITFAPETKTAWVEKRESLGLFPELLRTPRNGIPAFYDVRETGVDRVAGHKADRIEIVPRDELRFGYRIWAEKKSGLVVKMQTLDEQGAVLEQVAFSELQLDAPVRMDKLSQQMNDTRGYDVQRSVQKKTTPDAEGWRLKEPVPGFASMSCYTRGDVAGSTDIPGMQWVFSDGLASVSLFVEAFDAKRHGEEKVASVGATHSVTRRLDNHWLTVLGEVPTATLRRFADALERTR
ncbi:MucB/RseB C-terminal domain-containing protein [Hydrogenophaga sp.]|uniref:MucB/RseB C-terminal domain-containing protein n=1 Tax=Hydrogenophaga sp. TaxID=1904254 RepID=UPI0025C01D8C|nr:MucB/RseB C-terminal domain-containing protein [Hydrogenophaga sp.]